MTKTNAMRILDKLNIQYEVFEYTVDENDLSAEKVALSINADINQVFKTLVTIGDKTGYNVFVIQGNQELNLKKAALVSGNKRIEMIKSKDLPEITGYLRGGCSPIGMKKKHPTFLEEGAFLYNSIYISSGRRGAQILIAPNDLLKITDSQLVDLI